MLIRNSAQGPQSQVEVCHHHAPPTRRPLPDAVCCSTLQEISSAACLPGAWASEAQTAVTGRGGSPNVGDLQPKKGNNQQPEEESWLLDDLADRLAVSPKFKNSRRTNQTGHLNRISAFLWRSSRQLSEDSELQKETFSRFHFEFRSVIQPEIPLLFFSAHRLLLY